MEKRYYSKEYEDAYYMIECINNLVNCAENSVSEKFFEHAYDKENGSYRIMKELFDKDQYLSFYLKGFDIYIAILNNMVLKITQYSDLTQYRNLDDLYSTVSHVVSLSKNADEYFVERKSYGSHSMSVINNEGNPKVSSLICLNNHDKFTRKFKMPLNQMIKSTSIEQMKDRINKLRNRDQLHEQVSSFSDEEILKVLEFINANLENHQEQSKVLSKTL